MQKGKITNKPAERFWGEIWTIILPGGGGGAGGGGVVHSFKATHKSAELKTQRAVIDLTGNDLRTSKQKVPRISPSG